MNWNKVLGPVMEKSLMDIYKDYSKQFKEAEIEAARADTVLLKKAEDSLQELLNCDFNGYVPMERD